MISEQTLRFVVKLHLLRWAKIIVTVFTLLYNVDCEGAVKLLVRKNYSINYFATPNRLGNCFFCSYFLFVDFFQYSTSEADRLFGFLWYTVYICWIRTQDSGLSDPLATTS